nr:archease [candidate division Zixibacteria bacterium]
MPYKINDTHTSADIGLVVTGRDVVELFRDALLGLIEIMAEPSSLESSRNLPVQLTAETIGDLFFSWLAEILYLKDAENFLPVDCVLKIEGKDGFHLEGALIGDSIDPVRQILKIDVKAVTYHKFNIAKTGEKWRGEVVFDL